MVELIDLTLRDGLQMEPRVLSLDEKGKLYDRIRAFRPARIEVTSFVHPKWLPQFSDAENFLNKIAPTLGKGIPTMAFVPNVKGLERLLAFPIDWVTAFVATSETFNQKNVNQTVNDTLAELKKVVEGARAAKRKVRLYVSTLFGCPYEGAMKPERIRDVVARVAALGPDEIALSDTLGTATLPLAESVIDTSLSLFPAEKTALHVHDTYGTALMAIAVAFKKGIRKFDCSLGGTGGCPYAKGASGNVAIEDVAAMFARQSVPTGIDWAALEAALTTLKTESGLTARSRIAEIFARGGRPYGIG